MIFGQLDVNIKTADRFIDRAFDEKTKPGDMRQHFAKRHRIDIVKTVQKLVIFVAVHGPDAASGEIQIAGDELVHRIFKEELVGKRHIGVEEQKYVAQGGRRPVVSALGNAASVHHAATGGKRDRPGLVGGIRRIANDNFKIAKGLFGDRLEKRREVLFFVKGWYDDREKRFFWSHKLAPNLT